MGKPRAGYAYRPASTAQRGEQAGPPVVDKTGSEAPPSSVIPNFCLRQKEESSASAYFPSITLSKPYETGIPACRQGYRRIQGP
ncbi:MAG: hypothetical protein ABH867_02485 [Patescibacteria group bacterium]